MQLFTPGPSCIPQEILKALATPTIHHRSKTFQSLFTSCKSHLQTLCNLPYVFCLSSSGSGAMESAISSLNPSQILVLNHGKFSQRFAEISKALQIPTLEIIKEWNDNHNAKEVLECIKQNPQIDCVCLQTCESSGGVTQNYQEIAKAIKLHYPSILVIADGIASIGIESIECENLDMLIGASQKGLMLPVGMGFVWASALALDRLQSIKPKGFYLALQNYLKNEIAFSLPSCFFVALKRYFELVELEQNYKVVSERFILTRQILEQKGIRLYAKTPSKGVIAFEDKDEKIRQKLQQSNLFIGSGQGKLKNYISRIGNFGILQKYDRLLEALNQI